MYPLNIIIVVGFLYEFCLNFPLQNCRSNKFHVTIHVGTVTPLQKVRLKTIVNLFLPESDDDILKSRIAIFVTSNMAQPLIGFNDYISSKELLQQLENLNNSIERQVQILNDIHTNSLLYFNRYEAEEHIKSHVAIILCDLCSWKFDEEIKLNETTFTLKNNDMETYTIMITHFEIVTWESRKYNNKAFISPTDDLSNNQFVSMSLCGQCSGDWFLFKSKSSPTKLSCYKLEVTNSPFVRRKVLSLCEAFGAGVVYIETTDEYSFLQNTLGTVLYEASINSSVCPNVFNKIFCKGFSKHKQLSIMEKLNYGSCLRWEFYYNGSCGSDTDTANLLICKFEVDLYKCRESEISKERFAIQAARITNNQNYNELNVKLFACGTSEKSIPFTFVHDNYTDCEDGLDNVKQDGPFLCVGKLICDVRLNGKEVEKVCIENNKICDGKYDCKSKIDETNCNFCMETTLSDGSCLPSQWFYNDENFFFYKPRRDEAISYDKIQQVEEMLASCLGTECKHKEYPYIHVTRCNPGNKSMIINGLASAIQHHNVTWAAKCVYLYLWYRQEEFGCPDKSHLVNCEKFLCSDGLFKCSNSYCIPYYMVFDGRYDCPNGEDETVLIRNKIFSPKLFQCREPSILLHPAHVCDDVPQCPTLDDELHCYEKCPSGFTCQFGVTEVTDHSKVNHTHLFKSIDRSTRVLDLSGINLTQIVFSELNLLINLLEIHLSKCGLTNTIYDKLFKSIEYTFKHTTSLDLSYNSIDITKLPTSATSVFILNLSYTKVHTFVYTVNTHTAQTVDFSFSKLSSLKIILSSSSPFLSSFKDVENHDVFFAYLNLSNTHLTAFSLAGFHMIVNTFDLTRTNLDFTHKLPRFFSSLTITAFVYGDNFKLCCNKFNNNLSNSSVICFTPEDHVSSCSHLIAHIEKRSFLWLICVIGLIGNITVIIISCTNRHAAENKLRNFAIKIILSDFFMSVYLIIIAGADIYYRDDYVLYDNEWRDSSLCKAAGFLATLSYVASAVFVLHVTAQIYSLHRYAEHRLLTVNSVMSSVSIWCFCLMIPLFPTLYPDLQVYSSTSLCIGFPVHIKHTVGWLYSFSIYILATSAQVCLTITGLILTFKQICIDGRFNDDERHDIKLLSSVVVLNIFRGLIIACTGLILVLGVNASPNTIGWLVVLVLPLNSALNPILLIWLIVRKKLADFKKN